MTVLIYSYDLDERRTARIPASSQAEADAKLDAYLDSDDVQARSEFEAAYVEYHDEAADDEEEAEREGVAELVRALLSDSLDGSQTH